jgi:hypothetical protein
MPTCRGEGWRSCTAGGIVKRRRVSVNNPVVWVMALTVVREMCRLATTWLARRGREQDDLVVVVLADPARRADEITSALTARMRGRLGGRRTVRR